MRESLLREIDAQYETLRAENHAEEARRLAEATARDASIGALVTQRMRLFQNSAREALADPKRAYEISAALTQRVMEIQQALKERLVAAGLAADYLQPVYHCKDCQDTGYVGDPVKQRCYCHQRRVRQVVMAQTDHGINPQETFGAYNDSVYADVPKPEWKNRSQRQVMAEMRALCEGYMAEYPTNARPNLLLFGGSGLGKTYLLNCIGNGLLEKGVEVLKITAYQLTERMRASVFNRDEEAFSTLLQVPMLMLDDLGVEPMINNISIEQLFTLLNERSLRKLHTLVSTNLELEELEKRYNERICSRLFDRRSTVLLHFKGRDVRLGGIC